MKNLITNATAYILCLKYCNDNYCEPSIFFENLENHLEEDEVIIEIKEDKLITNQCRIIELNEII